MEEEDGIYRVQNGILERIHIDDDGLKKLKVGTASFEALRLLQGRMRKVLGGYKPDINLVADAVLLHGVSQDGIEEVVKRHCAAIFTAS